MKIRLIDDLDRLGTREVLFGDVVISSDVFVDVSHWPEAVAAKALANPTFEVCSDTALAVDAVELAELRGQAESLGIKVDGRWKSERLQAEIDAALSA